MIHLVSGRADFTLMGLRAETRLITDISLVAMVTESTFAQVVRVGGTSAFLWGMTPSPAMPC